ncbi:MAG TPA: aminoglycoside phosphotransferase family protein [Chloroflexia bacterium]
MREKPGISDEQIRVCLSDEYGLSRTTVAFLPLGLDTNAGVYRVADVEGSPYLLKVKSGRLYEPSCLVPRYLRDQGIAQVVAPLPTNRGALWAGVGQWTAMLYPFIEGVAGWDPPMTGEHWEAVGAALKRVHQVTLPSEGFESLRRETFDPAGYSRWIRAFEAQQAGSSGGSTSERALRSLWLRHQPTIYAMVSSMEALATMLQKHSGPYVVCHADLHPGNIIRDLAGGAFVVDWDDVMLAPKERDFIFAGGAPVDDSARQDTSPFFAGYGQAEIDWRALTYYLWERVVTDLIACAQDVFFRPDLEEETKIEAVQLFSRILAEGGDVDTARAAAAHLNAV